MVVLRKISTRPSDSASRMVYVVIGLGEFEQDVNDIVVSERKQARNKRTG